MTYRVTILLPVYNGEKYLQATIDNILQQTYTDFTLLIIDDGSTDSTVDIVRSYQDERISLLQNPTNIGLVDTLNKGIALCQTEFLARMDADDLWEKNKLEKQIQLMDKNSAIGLCGTSVRKFGTINGDFIFPITNDTLKVGFLFYCTMSHPSVVYRTSFLKKTGLLYQKAYFPAEDYKMWIDCLDKTTIYNIPEPLVHYRQHEEQICQEKKNIQDDKTNLVRKEHLLKLYPNATNEEIKFHIEKYVSYQIESEKDLKKHINWTKKLMAENKKSGYIAPKIMQKEIQTYLQTSIKQYMQQRYFAKRNRLLQLLRYILLGYFSHLSLKRNMSLLKNIIIKSK